MADSKKRTAGSQLTRDNPDPDENEPEPEMGSFKKASEDVMAKRKIVKVKRTQHQTAPTTNPFAGIVLAPPPVAENSEKSEKEAEKSEKSEENGENEVKNELENENKKENDSGVVEKSENSGNLENKTEVENKNEGENKTKTEGENKIEGEENKIEGEENKIEGENKTEGENNKIEGENINKTEEEKPVIQSAPFGSFGQLSSSQNAFRGLAGTGTGFSTGSPSLSTFSHSVPIFGTKPDTSLKEVQVETGEENESTVFNADAVLFEYLDGGWKERGKGEVKLNINNNNNNVNDNNNNNNVNYNKARLVMRTKGNYRLVLNASLYADMSLKDMDKRGVTFACLNSAGEGLGLGLTTFALKFKDGGVRDEFSEIVNAHKGDKEKESQTDEVAVLNAPENSPKEDEV